MSNRPTARHWIAAVVVAGALWIGFHAPVDFFAPAQPAPQAQQEPSRVVVIRDAQGNEVRRVDFEDLTHREQENLLAGQSPAVKGEMVPGRPK